jgi:hypothetical protein
VLSFFDDARFNAFLHGREWRTIRGFMTDGENETVVDPTAPLRDVPVDWEALEDAFENNAPEVHSYLHLKTGEVLRVVDGIADPEMHSRIASDSEYMRVEPVSSREQYRWMERFIPLVEDTELRQKLIGAIDGKGAFRRFKDVLMGHVQERERWFAFRSERLRVFMEAWMTAHSMHPVPRPVCPPEPTDVAEAPSDNVDVVVTARRSRGSEQLRRQLKELLETIGGRDLEKVLVFAEFVKARRASRTLAGRDEAREDSWCHDSSPEHAVPSETSSGEPAVG